MTENSKERPFRLIKRFLQNESFNEVQAVPFERIKNFPKKVA